MTQYKDITRDDLWFCYSKHVSKFLYEKHGLVPITMAINPNSNQLFSLFARSEKLQKALDDYKNSKNL